MRKSVLAGLLLPFLGLTVLPAAAAPAAGVSQGDKAGSDATIYTAAVISGKWTAMSMPPVTIAANRALGPASRLLVHLPDQLNKVNQADFALQRVDGNLWEQKTAKGTLSFKMVSTNFGVLKLVGDNKPGHYYVMPLYRMD